MTKFQIRHLPVLEAGKLVGIVSDRDIKLVETFRDVDAQKITVVEAYTPDPDITSPQASLQEVCDQMAAKKYSCVLVCDNHKLVGIFTWIDALKAMSELMGSRLKH